MAHVTSVLTSACLGSRHWVRLHVITVLRACLIVRRLYQASGCHFGVPILRACPICRLGMHTVISLGLKVCSDGILAGSQLLFGMMMRAGGQDADSGHRVRAMV